MFLCTDQLHDLNVKFLISLDFFFFGNKDLRRILTDYGFNGFPLRKDFPLTGFIDIYYDDNQKCICYQSLELSQEFRNFNFSSN